MNSEKTILVIDDNPTDLKLISSLVAAEGYQVVTANEAPVGIEEAMTRKPDLIVLDVMMPIINGYNICRLIKDQDDYAHIPVILLTSRTSEEDHRIGREVGANAYIAKPFERSELLSAIKQLLSSSL